ncbi:MAG: response regulator [Thaumarchaeota archaeon]|nr:MAG: response regulator [Nitrososphaerota archaeon]
MPNKKRNRLVAIIDDELDITVLFRDAMRGIQGISIFTFTNPIMALEHFKFNRNDYHLIVSDLRMPGINGIELIKRIKELNPLVRTILMTAFEIDDELFQKYAEEQLINGFLQKPIMLKDLVKEVDNQLHIRQLQEHKTKLQ